MSSLPLKWHGGKHYLASRIVELMPPHLHYVEPYFGGGAVLFAKPMVKVVGHSEVVNDIDGELMNFWDILSEPDFVLVFLRRIQAVSFSETSWNRAKALCDLQGRKTHFPCTQCAMQFFIRYRQSRQGLGKDFATLSRNRVRRGMNEQASAWLSAVEGLPEAHERLKRVVILSRDALEVIRQQDGPKTHFYCDPPYLPETRSATECYEHEMTVDQHRGLLSLLRTIKGTFQLSGYRSEIYDAYAKVNGWRRVEFDLPNNASSKKQKERKTESLWMNY